MVELCLVCYVVDFLLVVTVELFRLWLIFLTKSLALLDQNYPLLLLLFFKIYTFVAPCDSYLSIVHLIVGLLPRI